MATVVVAGIGVGLVSVAVLGFVAYSMLKKRVPIVVSTPSVTNHNRQQGNDDICKIQIATSDLKEIEALLIEHRKQYRVL